MPDRRLRKVIFISVLMLLTVFTVSVQACTGVTQEEDEQVFIAYTCPDDMKIEEGETVTV